MCAYVCVLENAFFSKQVKQVNETYCFRKVKVTHSYQGYIFLLRQSQQILLGRLWYKKFFNFLIRMVLLFTTRSYSQRYIAVSQHMILSRFVTKQNAIPLAFTCSNSTVAILEKGVK